MMPLRCGSGMAGSLVFRSMLLLMPSGSGKSIRGRSDEEAARDLP